MENNLKEIHLKALEILELKIKQEELLRRAKERIDLWNIRLKLHEINIIRETCTLEELEWDVKVSIRKIHFINRAYQRICGELCKVEVVKPVNNSWTTNAYNCNGKLVVFEMGSKEEQDYLDCIKKVNTQEECNECIKAQREGRSTGYQ